jgi:hypothetical protein
MREPLRHETREGFSTVETLIYHSVVVLPVFIFFLKNNNFKIPEEHLQNPADITHIKTFSNK